MRARQRHFLMTLVTAVAVALLAPPVVSAAQADVTCPGSTSWDNILQRCV